MSIRPQRRIYLFLTIAAALLCGSRVEAGRIMATPFAELTPTGEFRCWAFAIKEERAHGDYRFLYRLDAGLAPCFEFGILTIDPENSPASTWVNLQGLVVKEHDSWPTISIGVWDAANLGALSGRTTGASFFAAASRTVPLGTSGLGIRGPLKLNLGWGTNRLNGFFGGAVLPISTRAGVQAEYLPKNLRLTGADAVNAGIYYFLSPTVRARATWAGGNPMVDIFFSRKIR